MNVNHLKAFFEVAKAKSFTLAAKQLNVSQPTLSMQVKSLEKRFAVPLIKRNKKTFELTEEGNIVFGHSEKIFALLRELKKELENFETHNMIIGSTPYICPASVNGPHAVTVTATSSPMAFATSRAVSRMF